MRKKRSSWKCLTSVLALSLGITLSALPGCKTVDSFGVRKFRSSGEHGVQKFRSVDTVVVRDSVFVSEKQRNDTVYLTRVEWRDRWRTRVERDTVVDVRVEKEVVAHPPERYVPKFYRWCTVLLFAMLALLVLRWWLKRRL